MEIEFKGANCIVINGKKEQIVIDPNIEQFNLKNPKVENTIQIVTQPQYAVDSSSKLLISEPGEYETSTVSVIGIPANAVLDATNNLSATMYVIRIDGYSIAVLGHISVATDEAVLEMLGVVDVLIVPVGGNGYTLDGHDAATIARRIEPKVIIPTHYSDTAINYPLQQDSLDLFLKELGTDMPNAEPKYKLKSLSSEDKLRIVVLQRTK